MPPAATGANSLPIFDPGSHDPGVFFARSPLFPVLICALLWGSAFPAIKSVYHHWEALGLRRSLPVVLLFAGVRFSLAGLGLLSLGRHLFKQLRVTSWRLILGFAFTQTFIQYLFFYQAVAISSASLTALLTATGSLWWMLLAPLIQKTPWPSPIQWAGLLMGGVGVALAIYQPGAGAGRPVAGAVLMLTATASGALAVIIFSRLKTTMTARNATGLSLLFGGLGLLSLGAPSMSHLPTIFDQSVFMATLWLAFVSATAFSIWNSLTTLFPVTLLASYRFLIPVCGVLEALIFLKTETPGWGLICGGSLVIASMLIARRTTGR